MCPSDGCVSGIGPDFSRECRRVVLGQLAVADDAILPNMPLSNGWVLFPPLASGQLPVLIV